MSETSYVASITQKNSLNLKIESPMYLDSKIQSAAEQSPAGTVPITTNRVRSVDL